MHVGEFQAFSKRVTWLFALYPNASLGETTTSSWWSHLEDLAWPAVDAAIGKAPTTSKQFVPSAEQVRELAEVEAARLAQENAEQRHERLLAAPPAKNPDRKALLQAYYASCDTALQRAGGLESIDDANVVEIERVLMGMASLFCVDSRTYLDGRKNLSTKDTEEIGMLKPTVNEFKQRKLSPGAVLKGLRRVPMACRKFPTLGMLVALARDESLRGYPSDWVVL